MDTKKIQQAACIPDDYIGKTINDYEFLIKYEQASWLVNIQKYIDNIGTFIPKNISLYLYSNQGSVGKTFFAAVILNHAIQKGFQCKFLSFIALKNKSLYTKRPQDIFSDLLEYDLIIIDNIDRHVNKSFLVNDDFLSCFEEFLELRKKPIIFTSSVPLSLEKLSKDYQQYDTINIIRQTLKNNIVDIEISAEQYYKKTIWDNL